MQPQPVRGRRGRRRKACDNCAKIREPCDGNTSCASCQTRRLPCTYRRLEGTSGEAISPTLDVPAISTRSQSQGYAETQDKPGPGKASVPFLLDYSAPTNRNPGDVNHALTLLSTAESRDPDPDPALPSFDVESDRQDLFVEESWNMFFDSYRREDDSHKSLPRGLDDPNLRSLAATRIINCLSDVHRQYPACSDNYCVNRARDFFYTESISDFTKAYFEHTVRPRSRVVLKTTFNLESISVPLLLSILIMGATCGTSDSAKSQAVEYANMAEFAVFENPTFLRLVYRKRDHDEPIQKNDLEIVQAALLVILVQIASPDTEARRRIRIQRYPALVSVARATSLAQTKNRWHDKNTPLCHEEFLINEACIRSVPSSRLLR